MEISEASTLLPAEPTLDEAGSQEVLGIFLSDLVDLMLESREKFSEAIALSKSDSWSLSKGIQPHNL